ncbi:hypothetical protein N8Z76_00455 [Gammaproteobacteria bacterium]|nr:hypothetical protein [Gammaproteobacteria bacterium]
MDNLKRILKEKWEARECMWPHPDGWATYNQRTNMILDTGLTKARAEQICKKLNQSNPQTTKKMKKIEKWSLAIKELKGFTLYGEFYSESAAQTIGNFLPASLEWKIILVKPSFSELVEAYSRYDECAIDSAIWEMAEHAQNDDDIRQAINDFGVESDFDREDLSKLLDQSYFA